MQWSIGVVKIFIDNSLLFKKKTHPKLLTDFCVMLMMMCDAKENLTRTRFENIALNAIALV